MFKKITKNPFSKALLVTAAIMIFLLLPIVIVSNIEYKQILLENKREEAAEDLHEHAVAFEKAVYTRVSMLAGLEVYTKTHIESLNDKDFEMFASVLISSIEGIRNIIIAPDGINRYVFPIEGNEEAVGHDIINDKRPNVRESVQRAIKMGELAVSGPYELRQGGVGIVFRKAIFIDGEFWGLVSEVIDMVSLYEIAGLYSEHHTLIFAVRRDEENLHGESTIFDEAGTLFT